MIPRNRQKIGGIVSLLILTAGGLITLYQALFDIWMTAYPFANASEWRGRLYLRLATLIVIGIAWSTIGAWFLRQRRKEESSARNR